MADAWVQHSILLDKVIKDKQFCNWEKSNEQTLIKEIFLANKISKRVSQMHSSDAGFFDYHDREVMTADHS